MNDTIIHKNIAKSKTYYFNLLKKDKILNYRKKNASIRHEYYTLSNKYSNWNKCMLSFTVPNASISPSKQRNIKNGRFTKLRTLIALRAYIAKLINNSDDIRYFMNIELGKAYSNPHIHVQLWLKNPITSSTTIDLIREKAIKKFGLNSKRCYTTLPEKDLDIYHYVIKDYAKDLTDKQIWDLETQKKRFRKQLGKKVRFYSKSTDKYTKKIYRIVWKWGIGRDIANDFISFFKNNFMKFNKKTFFKFSFFCINFSELFILKNKRIENVFAAVFVLVVAVFRFSPSRDPPKFKLFFIYARINV